MNFNEQLNEYYSDNGKVFGILSMAMNFLKKHGYYQSNGMFRNDHGQKAFLTKIKDYTFDKSGNKKVQHVGWLVTLGGEPVSYTNLKLSPIAKE